MKKFLKYAVLTLMWGAVTAYIVYAARTSHAVRVSKKVRSLRIEIVDSTSQGQLVSTSMVRSWIDQSHIATVGAKVDAVDLPGLEQLIARNGFVDRAVAYVSYAGELHIDISQRKPVVRLLTDGMDSYTTSEGHVFAAPLASSLYVPVVTGGYQPPFPATYVGSVRAYVDAQKRKVDERIARLEGAKYPFFEQELENDRKITALRRERVKRRWWLLESSHEFETRADQLRKDKVVRRRALRYQDRVIQQRIDSITCCQQAERLQQKKLDKNYEDFMKLLTFVEQVEQDDFWRSEVVQIVAGTTPSGALEVDLIPRSGSHTVRFGRLEQVDEKLSRLMRFYRNGLSGIGWNEYRTIDIRFRDQVVCKK